LLAIEPDPGEASVVVGGGLVQLDAGPELLAVLRRAVHGGLEHPVVPAIDLDLPSLAAALVTRAAQAFEAGQIARGNRGRGGGHAPSSFDRPGAELRRGAIFL